ncbi:MAG TPA: adenosylmethionine--8-amino-7-oxononanoate transaminase [Chitinophagaceae bacterium]|jgi:adenosylmethionine-8-amino-7-oxononanoate aminotransferase
MNLQQRDKAVIWHPFTPLRPAPEPIPIVKGEGTLLVDEAGNQYIDAVSSWWVNLHGHAHPYIAEKIYQQALTLEQVIFAGFTHRPAVELAERLLPLLPGPFSKIFYSDNGSTSTEVALKMALQYWWNRGGGSKLKILAFNNAYHGDTFGSMSVSDRSVFTKAFHELLFDVVFIDTPEPGNIAQSKAIIAENGPGIAAFIYEPLVQGAGGMKMYGPGLMDELLAFVKAQGILCIADEVMTGFYRTGKLFASEWLQQKPDIICLSKGLTGGTMALGVTAVTQPVIDAFTTDDAMKTFFHGHSFTANPLACTAALASLDLLEKPGCLRQITAIVEQNNAFVEELRASPTGIPVKNIRQLGTIVAFEIDKGKDEYLNTISAGITQQALKAGVYLRPLGNTVYIMPPYCIDRDQLSQVYEVIKKAILCN